MLTRIHYVQTEKKSKRYRYIPTEKYPQSVSAIKIHPFERDTLGLKPKEVKH